MDLSTLRGPKSGELRVLHAAPLTRSSESASPALPFGVPWKCRRGRGGVRAGGDTCDDWVRIDPATKGILDRCGVETKFRLPGDQDRLVSPCLEHSATRVSERIAERGAEQVAGRDAEYIGRGGAMSDELRQLRDGAPASSNESTGPGARRLVGVFC